MLRKLLIRGFVPSLAVLVLAAPATAATRQTLMPGVTYERAVQFTNHGPVALHIVRGPKPTGLYELRPVLSNDAIQGLERVTAMQKRLSAEATMVGINGDFYNFDSGRPSGVLMRDGVVDSPPYGDRSSVGVSAEGVVDVRRIQFFGTWKGLGQRRSVNDVNQLPGANGIALFTPSYGSATPAQSGAVTAVLSPFPPATPNTDLVGAVTALGNGAGTPIPAGGAVLVARGTAAQKLAEEAPIGTSVVLRLIFRPQWAGITQAIGGGPVIVRNSRPVFRSLEAFEPSQLVPRNPRTAVGQLASGRVIMVATDGRRPGYSVGMTNFELAQTLVRLGAVTGSAFDAGGSTTVAFEGELLNRPSDPSGERAVSTSLQLMYYGTVARSERPVVSPNGDGVDETQQLLYKVVRPSTVTATLTAPGGQVAFTETIVREPGTYAVAFPPASADPNVPPAAPAEGRWQLAVTAADDIGRTSKTSERFTVNNTLGDVKLARRKITVRARGKQFIQAGVNVTRAARLRVTVETRSGVQVATIAVRRITEPGRFLVRWRGTTRGGRALVYGGDYVLRFRAGNELGVTELTSRPFKVVRAAPPKKKPKKQS
ncbi:MAG TPA: phosphodiester glycosidase family protein [Gaiellaceae bacterium]|nr:phosphodiester glycosidase family protein [Gaiellaceae bacterium]